MHSALTSPIDVPIYQDVHLGLLGDRLRLLVLIREGVIPHVREQICGPWWGHPFRDHDVTCADGSLLPGLC